MGIKKVTWDDVTLKMFNQIQDILESPDEYTVYNLIDVIYNVQVSDLSVTEVSKYSLDFLSTPVPVKNVKLKDKYVLNGKTYNSNIDLTEVKTSQFIDFTNYVKDNPNDFAKLLSVFIIPEGHTYNNGYNIKEVQDDILQMPIADVQSLAFFMIKQLHLFAIIFQTYFVEHLEKMKNTAAKQPAEQILKELISACSLY